MPQQTDPYEPIEQERSQQDTQELPRRPRRRLLTPLPLALAGVLLIACGFIAGVLVEKGQTSSSPSTTGASSGLASRFAGLRSALSGSAGARGNAASGFAARFGGGATVGQVAYVHDGTLYVTDAEGNTVRVDTSEASTVTKTVKAGVKQIHPGETVTVTGDKGAGGAILARSISVGSSPGGGLAALFGAGAATGGSQTAKGGAGPSGGQSLFGG
jgi:hypothetical protein